MTGTRRHLTPTQRRIAITVTTGATLIAAAGFAGSYTAVRHLALQKGFGWFATVLPAGIDAGIIVLLALDLLLTWLRIPFPLLRPTAWFLTAATIAFNGAAAWPDPLGVGMHAVIPVLFVITTEAARHAIGRTADIEAGKDIETPPLTRWIVAPVGTARIRRRQVLWGVRSYGEIVEWRRQVRVFRMRLRKAHGRAWRRRAPAEKLLVLTLATREGLTIAEAEALPEREAEARRQAEFERQEEARVAEAARQEEARLAEEKRLASEAERRRLEREDKEAAELAAIERRRCEEQARRERQVAEAEAAAKLAEIARTQQEADEEKERRRELQEARVQAEVDRLAAESRAAAEEQERRQRVEAQEHAEQMALLAKQRADAIRREREDTDRQRVAAAELQKLRAATAAARPATPAATSSATDRRPATGTAATATPAAGSATRPGPAATDATGNPYESDTAHYVIYTLWLGRGHRPTEGDIVVALERAGLPNSRAQAGKVRRQVAAENPGLPGPRAGAA